jgi:hypothetical protein
LLLPAILPTAATVSLLIGCYCLAKKVLLYKAAALLYCYTA